MCRLDRRHEASGLQPSSPGVQALGDVFSALSAAVGAAEKVGTCLCHMGGQVWV